MSKRLQIYISGPDAEVSNAFIDGDVIRPNDPSKDMVLRNVEIRIVDLEQATVFHGSCWFGGPPWPRTVPLRQDG